MSGSKGSSSSGETSLSRAQAALLGAREKQYQSFFFPELIRELNDSNQRTNNTAFAREAVQSTNRAFQGANQQFQQQTAQRGLAGSGIEVQGLASLNSARARALGDAMMKAELAKQQKKSQLLQMGGSLSPQPTTAAPMSSESEQKSGFGMGFAGIF